MKKGLVISILTILMLAFFSANLAQAVDPSLSIQPPLIQDEEMKPSDPPPESHPTAHQYTAPVTNPAKSYDNDHATYSLTNITQQPYPNKYSRPTTDTHNATVSGDANAYDMNQGTYASITIDTVPADGMREFSPRTFNTSALTAVSSLDLKIKYAATINTAGSNYSYKIVLYVGTKNLILIDRTWTNVSTPDTTDSWIGVTEPTDGLWSLTDMSNLRISFETQEGLKAHSTTFKVYEVWALVYPPLIRYYDLRTFSPTTIPSYSYLNVVMNYTAIIGESAYRILVSVGSANTTVQDWVDVSQLNPLVITWQHIAEPNDGWWSQSDLSNMKIIIETQKIESAYNNGELYIYEAWVTIDPPTLNPYPGAHGGTATVTSPTNAYDKNQMTYASISAPATTTYVTFILQSFNTTTLKEYTTINIQMKYNFTAWKCQYKIYVQVGSKTMDLQPPTSVNRTTPILATWIGVCEPNDGSWSQSDLTSMQVIVGVRRTSSTGGYNFGFREYETWATLPKAHFTVRVNVSGVQSSAPLYAWEFNITFNPAVLQVAAISEGPFLKQAPPLGVTHFSQSVSNTVGWVVAACAVDDWFSGGTYGSGNLATITFQAIAKGNSMFNFTNTQLRSFDEVHELPIPLAHTRSPGWFQYLAGDVNGDAIVDVHDLYQLGQAYGTTSGGLGYDADADLDKDGDVDSGDLITVKTHYGHT